MQHERFSMCMQHERFSMCVQHERFTVCNMKRIQQGGANKKSKRTRKKKFEQYINGKKIKKFQGSISMANNNF